MASDETISRQLSSVSAVDAHLVMNALNHIAAKTFQLSGVENPLLFALSEYLREALVRSGFEASSVADECALVESYLNLLSQMSRAQLQSKVRCDRAADMLIRSGLASHLVLSFFKALNLKAHAQWFVFLEFAPGASGVILSISAAPAAPVPGAFDLTGAREAIDHLRAVDAAQKNLASADVSLNQAGAACLNAVIRPYAP